MVHQAEQLRAHGRRQDQCGGLQVGLCDTEEMCRSVGVKLQRAGYRVEDLRGRSPFAPLLEPGVVTGTHPSEECHLLASQSVDAAVGIVGQPRLLRRDQVATRPEKVAEFVVSVHATDGI